MTEGPHHDQAVTRTTSVDQTGKTQPASGPFIYEPAQPQLADASSSSGSPGSFAVRTFDSRVQLPGRTEIVTRVSPAGPEQVLVLSTKSAFQPRFEDPTTYPITEALVVGRNVTAMELTEVPVDPDCPAGTPEAAERAVGVNTEKLTSMYAAGEGQTSVYRIDNGRVSVAVMGGVHTNNPIDTGRTDTQGHIQVQSSFVEGASGYALDPTALNEHLNELSNTWATVVTTAAPVIAESKGKQNLTDALLTVGGMSAVAANRIVPVPKAVLAATELGLISQSVDLGRYTEPDAYIKQLKDENAAALAEVRRAYVQGGWENVWAVGIPRGLTGEAAARYLELVASRVEAANPSELPYKYEIVRTDTGEIATSTTVNKALGKIPGIVTMASTEFVAQACGFVPDAEVGNVQQREINVFGIVDAEAKGLRPGPRIEVGDILGRFHQKVGTASLRIENLAKHTFLGGDSGTGKTELAKRILRGAVENDIGMLGVAVEKAQDLYPLGAQFIQDWERSRFIDATRPQIEAANNFIIAFLTNKAIRLEEKAQLIAQYLKVVPTQFQIPELVLLGNTPDRAIEHLTERIAADPQDTPKERILHPFSWREVGIEAVPEEWRPPFLTVVRFDQDADMVGWNIWEPAENISVKAHVAARVEALVSNYEGSPEGRVVLETYAYPAALRAFAKNGIDVDLGTSQYPGGIDHYPTLAEWRQCGIEEIEQGDVKDKKNLTYGANIKENITKFWNSAVGRLEIGNLGELFNINAYPLTLEKIDKGRTLWDTSTWNERENGVFMRLLIQTLIQIREQQQKQPGYTAADLHPIILFMDELHALMPKVPDGMISTASGMFANLIAIGRSLGIWIVAASQRAGDIVEDAYKQPGINIALRVSNKEEREKVLSSAGIDTDSTRGQHMMRQAGTFPPGVGALAQPLNKVPLEVAFYSPEGTSTDPTQVLSAGVLTNERPPTRKQFRLAEKFFEDNDEVAQALKEWAAFICLTQAKDFRGNRLVLPGYEGMEPYMNVALDPKIIEFFLSKNPRQIQAILRMAASEAAGDRAVLLLNTINPGEAQTPDHIPNTKERMAEKIYRILHNSIYVHDQDQETHAPVPLLAAVPGETTASPYQYERGVYLLTQMLAEDPDRSQNIPIPIVAELKALHHLPPWLDETLSISAALERLLEHQRDAINKNSGVDGTGAWLFGRKAMAGGGWLESAVGVRWYDATFSDKLAVVIDKFVPDPKEARLLKKEFGHFIELRHRDRRIQSLKNARLALETWLAEYGKKTAQREVATETVRGAIREARRDAGIDEVVERVMVAMTTANAAVEIEREAGDTERDIIRDAVRQVIRETGGETARDAIRGAVIAEMRAAGKDVEDRPQRPDEYDAAYPHRYVFVNDGLELEGTTAYELLRSVYVQLSALEPQTKDPLSPAEREQVEAKKREAMERLAHV